MLKLAVKPLINLAEGDLVASLDLGSNSFHFLLATYTKGELKVIQRLSEKVQLAAGLDAENYLDKESQARGLACLAQIAPLLAGVQRSKLSVVATNTLRVATNANQFLEAAEQVLGVPVQVISGVEEARLVYLGVVKSNPSFSDKCLVVDIGGGSTEFILGEAEQPLELTSLNMGCVSYTKRFFIDTNKVQEREFKAALQAAKAELTNLLPTYLNLGWDLAYGSSGSMKVLAQVANLGQLGSLTLSKLQAMREELLLRGAPVFWQNLGVRRTRLDLIPAGLAIALAAFEVLGIERMNYSDGALREGLLHQLLEKPA